MIQKSKRSRDIIDQLLLAQDFICLIHIKVRRSITRTAANRGMYREELDLRVYIITGISMFAVSLAVSRRESTLHGVHSSLRYKRWPKAQEQYLHI